MEDITVENGTASNLRGSGTAYTADITPLTPGTVTVNIAAGVARSTKDHDNVTAKQFSITYEIPKPIVITHSSRHSRSTYAATPAITAEPAGTTVSVGGTADLSITASVNGGTVSYQWYSTDAIKSGESIIAGATDAIYAVPTDTEGTFYYYCIVIFSKRILSGDYQ